ncbi:uncharacterized protein DNG_01105 [Cephalotrichum gorgonifer]|uniref:Uncharacterized protein n=1 Tax=Cephalotrichum gorgonifer TaxID=2041049 RepID=A0AAE8MS15_9PEZI|nr:uncharacterized protein DNG_01105 [Cephalotrichum gorgonifer]
MSSSSRTNVMATTPKRTTKPAVTESPGNWSHPRLREITRRRNATTFTDRNVRTITQNIGAIVALHALRWAVTSFVSLDILSASLKSTASYVFLALLVPPFINILLALLPLFRPEDTLSDIPLTPSQRRLLNLPPSSAAPTPNAVYSTPPRYSRTPSISGSIASSVSSRASVAGNAPTSPYSPAASPLQGKGFNPTRNGRRSSFGSPSPLGGGSGGGNGGKLFEGVTSPSPSGKKTSVGLNSKWLYERGRRSSGSWMQ